MKDADNIGTLIVDSMKTCQNAMRAMIDAHDRLFGAGSGQADRSGKRVATISEALDSPAVGESKRRRHGWMMSTTRILVGSMITTCPCTTVYLYILAAGTSAAMFSGHS
jgi:hypothetical protein